MTHEQEFAIMDPLEKGISPRLGSQGRHASPKRVIDNLPHVPHLVSNQGIQPGGGGSGSATMTMYRLPSCLRCSYASWVISKSDAYVLEDNVVEKRSLEDIIAHILSDDIQNPGSCDCWVRLRGEPHHSNKAKVSGPSECGMWQIQDLIRS